MDVTIYPEPNPALTHALLAAPMRGAVFASAEVAQALYVGLVAKRTLRLARSARVSTEIGGADHDRHIGVLTVGGASGGGDVDYAASHEFGVKADVEGPVEEFGDADAQGNPVHELDDNVVTGGHHAAHDLNAVLEMLGGL